MPGLCYSPSATLPNMQSDMNAADFYERIDSIRRRGTADTMAHLNVTMYMPLYRMHPGTVFCFQCIRKLCTNFETLLIRDILKPDQFNSAFRSTYNCDLCNNPLYSLYSLEFENMLSWNVKDFGL